MNRHESMRGYFAYYLHNIMKDNPRVYLLTGDLGYKMFDNHFQDFSDRCFNCGASEQSMMGIACGLSMQGKIPVVYSITPFLIYRSFETIRNYVNNECLNVKLFGSGRDKDYAHDGFSHDASDVKYFMNKFEYIEKLYPEDKTEIPSLMKKVFKSDTPCFVSLRR